MVTRRKLLQSIAVGAVVAPSMTLKAKEGTVALEKRDVFSPTFAIGPETFTAPCDGMYQINMKSEAVEVNGFMEWSHSSQIRPLEKNDTVKLNEKATAYLIT